MKSTTSSKPLDLHGVWDLFLPSHHLLNPPALYAQVELDEGALARDISIECFYYFRDSNFLNSVAERGDRAALQSEGVLSRERLSHLKSKLRLSGLPPSPAPCTLHPAP